MFKNMGWNIPGGSFPDTDLYHYNVNGSFLFPKIKQQQQKKFSIEIFTFS